MYPPGNEYAVLVFYTPRPDFSSSKYADCPKKHRINILDIFLRNIFCIAGGDTLVFG